MENLKYAISAIEKFKKHGYSNGNVRLRNKKLPKIDSNKFILGDLTDQSFNNMEPDKIYHCDEEYFYKSYNIISESDQIDLKQEVELYLKTHKKDHELEPKVQAGAHKFLTAETLRKKCWKNLMQKIVRLANSYSKKYLNLNTNLSLDSYWITSLSNYTDEIIKYELLFDKDFEAYTDNHVHAHEPIQLLSCVFYLQNPDKKYGTLVETKNNFLVLDGAENSLTIFNPTLYHQALLSPREISSKYPRNAIIFNFKK